MGPSLSNTQWILIVIGVGIAAWMMSKNRALSGMKLGGPVSSAGPGTTALQGNVTLPGTNTSIWGSLKL